MPAETRHDDPDLRARHAVAWVVWGLWGALSLLAFGSALLGPHHARRVDAAPGMPAWAALAGVLLNAGILAAGNFALLIAVRRVRGIWRLADAFYSLVLLNPLLISRAAGPFDRALLAAGLLALMAGAIIAMKRDSAFRYVGVTGLALALAGLSDVFIMLLPPIAAWLLFAGFLQARAPQPSQRVRGFVVMAGGEICVVLFGLACIFAPANPTPAPATLFSTIVSFGEFPLLVLAIVMLALGWRKEPPPYFWGMLALLVGLLAMLLNNFQAETLPPPGADQTALILCLLYTVSALHGPRRLQWLIPSSLLAAAVAYTFFR